jgi:hypothetical protein
MMGTTIRAFAAADIKPGTDTRDRMPEATAAELPAADTTEATDSAEVKAEAFMAAGCREVDFMVAAGSPEAEATAGKN